MNDDIFVVAGDNIILDELSDLIKFFYQIHSSVIGVYRAKNYEDVKKGSSILLDDKNRIIEFIEKPENSKTNLVGACVYVFPSLISIRLEEYLKNKLSQDEPGRFIEWLHKMDPVYGYMLKNYLWDIGTLDVYNDADNYFRKLG
jgi:glucose-1-phosphate thymidylyltransferase